MRRFSFVWGAAYFVALLLIVNPIVDVTIAALPFRPGEMTWRFAAIGIFAEGVMTPLLGFLFILLIATYLGHRSVVRAVGWLCAIGFVAFLGVIGLFAVEATSMRELVAEEVQAAFGIASVAALLKHVTGAVGTGLMAVGAFKESARLGRNVEGKADGSIIFSPDESDS